MCIDILGITQGTVCTSAKEQRNGSERLAFYMDLVSHDMLNDNQAVLSYLELILANPDLDMKAVDYAKKAISHVRSSTMRLENIKTLVTARKRPAGALGTTDLVAAIGESIEDLPRILPSKRITVRRPSVSGKAAVTGGGVVTELLTTVMASVAKLDPENDLKLNLRMTEEPGYGNRGWTVMIEDPNVRLPAVVKEADIDAVHTKDSSLAGKVSGFLFAKMAAEAIGGSFDIQSGESGEAVFVLRLRRDGSV